jgi:hypothetical protein
MVVAGPHTSARSRPDPARLPDRLEGDVNLPSDTFLGSASMVEIPVPRARSRHGTVHLVKKGRARTVRTRREQIAVWESLTHRQTRLVKVMFHIPRQALRPCCSFALPSRAAIDHGYNMLT